MVHAAGAGAAAEVEARANQHPAWRATLGSGSPCSASEQQEVLAETVPSS